MMELLQNLNFDLIMYGVIGVVILYIILKLFKWPLKLLLNGISGVILLYIVNSIGAIYNFHIGINLVTALVAGILGIPGVIVLIIIKLFM